MPPGRVLTGDAFGLDERGHALAAEAHFVTRDPNWNAAEGVEWLREAGWTDQQVFAATAFVAAWLAFSTVHATSGALPDEELGTRVPPEMRDAVTWEAIRRGWCLGLTAVRCDQ